MHDVNRGSKRNGHRAAKHPQITPATPQSNLFDVSERDKRRIGNELRDVVCQELAGITFQLQSLHKSLESSGALNPAVLADTIDLLQNTLRHARGVAEGLCPVNGDPNELPVALSRLSEQTSRIRGISCTCRCNQSPHIAQTSMTIHLYRIAEEAVRDAIDHGGAKNIMIELGVKANLTRLTISDDGITASRLSGSSSNSPIEIMKQRSLVIGGALRTEVSRRSGVRVICEIPHPKRGDR